MASLQPSNAHDGNPHISPGKSKADSQEACVEPTDVMRKEHYLFLLHQRDETVVNGIRTKNHSLANCIDCHVSYDEKGKAIPINAEGQFCQDCHVKTATNITCFLAMQQSLDTQTMKKQLARMNLKKSIR